MHAGADWLADECEESKKQQRKETKYSLVDTDSKRRRADVLRADMLACGGVAYGWMRCVWTRISVKKKKKKKDLLGHGCERVDALACRCKLSADDCENKEEKKKRKETLTGCRSWSRMVVDVWNAQMASSGGAVDDSARVSLYLEIFV